MNSKAQSFDVFKLLIAAVIAVVILSVLMNLLSSIFLPTGKPIEVAGRTVKSLRTPLYTITSSEPVTFTPKDSINRDALAEQVSGLLPSQICLSAGVYSTNEALWNQGEGLSSVMYTGTTNQEVKFRGVCGRAGRLKEGDFFGDKEILKQDWFTGDCACLTEEDDQECCLMAIVRK